MYKENSICRELLQNKSKGRYLFFFCTGTCTCNFINYFEASHRIVSSVLYQNMIGYMVDTRSFDNFLRVLCCLYAIASYVLYNYDRHIVGETLENERIYHSCFSTCSIIFFFVSVYQKKKKLKKFHVRGFYKKKFIY